MTLYELVAPASVAASIAVVGYLLSRSIREIDQKLDRNTLAVDELKLQVHGYELLAKAQDKRIDHLEHENRVLRNASAATDRQIAVMVALHKLLKPEA